MLGARFRVDVHNQRRMVEHRGTTPAETLDRFHAIIGSTTAPSGHTPAYLGEVVVHAQDIRQPLGLPRTPDVDALTPVAEFFARRNFTVASRTAVAGLQLRADDGPFATGTGPLVTGSTLALVMSMAGRAPYIDQLDGPGVPTSADTRPRRCSVNRSAPELRADLVEEAMNLGGEVVGTCVPRTPRVRRFYSQSDSRVRARATMTATSD